MKMSRLPSSRQLKAFSRRAIAAASALAVSIIKRRTAQGRAIGGGAFPSYSADYSKKKAGSGRNSYPADLTVTGELLGALKVLRVESATRAIIGWSGQHRKYSFEQVKDKEGKTRMRRVLVAGPLRQIKRGKNAGKLRPAPKATIARYRVVKQNGTVPYAVLIPALNKLRPFFGISRDERAELVRVFQATMDAQIADHAQKIDNMEASEWARSYDPTNGLLIR